MAEQSGHILVVDDEKNIRLTLSHTLEQEGYEVRTAMNGEEALEILEDETFDLMLLDLRMPGMDGTEVLQRVVEKHPQVKVIMVTAHGTVDSAVEAMKVGAVDFLQKPFAPQEIREMVARLLDPEQRQAEQTANYEKLLELAHSNIEEDRFEAAMEHVDRAIGEDASRPEAFNLKGVLQELDHDRHSAMQNYRIALDLDPTYEPAQNNLSRSPEPVPRKSGFDLG